MARIRTIKPEFWEDENVGVLSREARLLFIACWNLADDEGLLRWTAPYIKASVFMYDDDITIKRAQSLMGELEASGMVFAYTAGKAQQALCYVVNFHRHQRINRPQPGKFPPPPVQSKSVLEMYVRRDKHTCHLCKHPVNWPATGAPADPYASKAEDTTDLNPSLDHLVPRSKGGSDSPSNIGLSHIACNKARCDRPIEAFTPPASVHRLIPSLHDSLNESVNEAVNTAVKEAVPGSPPERKRKGKGSKEREGDTASQAAAGAARGEGRDEGPVVPEPVPEESEPLGPFQEVEAVLKGVAARLETPEPTSEEVRRWLAASSPLRRLIGKFGIPGTIELGCYAMTHSPGCTWGRVWEANASFASQMRKGCQSSYRNGKAQTLAESAQENLRLLQGGAS